MRPQVSAELAEARRRTDLHLSRRVAPLHAKVRLPAVVDRDFLVPDAPPFGSPTEEKHAEALPSGAMAVVLVVLAVLGGLAATVAVTWSGWAPRVLGLLR